MAGAESSSFDNDFREPSRPPQKSLKLAKGKLQRKPQPDKDRFALSTEQELEKAREGYTPKNTIRSTDWSMRVFCAWRDHRNERCEDKCPMDLLDKPTIPLLNKWLSAFVVEARREDGQRYPATTISQLLAGLWRYARSKTVDCPNFMDRKDRRFDSLNGAIASVFRKLREDGVGATVKHVAVIRPDEEEILWNTGTIGDHNPLALQRAVYYYVGKVFCLRGGEEQRGLKLSQLKRSTDPDCYTYIENGSKNRSGMNTTVANKIVPVYALPERRPRCLVYLLDLYISKIPLAAKERNLFYVRPVTKMPVDCQSPWYENAPVGKEKLRSFISAMCKEAGITEPKTNHSLRATGTTAMFSAKVPERMIRDVTGHRSNALMRYEHPSVEQKRAVSAVLMNGPEKKENQPVSKAPVHETPTAARAPMPPSMFGSMFSNLTNCSISITPHNFVVNVNSPPVTEEFEQVDEEYDRIVTQADLDI